MIPGDEGPQKTALYEELSEDNRALEWEEKKRQLYVAMTRAEKYLFLSAAVSEEKESVRRENGLKDVSRAGKIGMKACAVFP